MSLVKYFIIGAICALVDLLLFFFCLHVLSLPWFVSAVISFFLATLLNLVLSKRFVFYSGYRFNRRTEALLVYAASGVGLIFNQLMLYIHIALIHSHLLVAKISATASVFVWNYFARRYLIFGVSR